MSRTVIQVIASAIQARANCIKSGNKEWQEKWEERLKEMEDRLPSGSGFDRGTKIDLDRSWPYRQPASFITLTTSYHHMNEYGYYTHWSDHELIVRPVFEGSIDITVRGTTAEGEDADEGWEDYVSELFHTKLSEIVEEYRYAEGEVVKLVEKQQDTKVRINRAETRWGVTGYWIDTQERLPIWVPEEAVYRLEKKA